VSRKVFIWALYLELILGVTGVVWRYLLDRSLLLIDFQRFSAVYLTLTGIAAGAGVGIIVVILIRLSPGLLNSRSRQIAHMLSSLSWSRAIAISLAAGLCEELLFRGAMQPAFGIWLTSVLFALVHPYGRLYIVVSFVASLLLGQFYILTGSIVAPVAAHAFYDFAVIAAVKFGGFDIQPDLTTLSKDEIREEQEADPEETHRSFRNNL
jgi:membrane protease YdiL (CAAX protease family)